MDDFDRTGRRIAAGFAAIGLGLLALSAHLFWSDNQLRLYGETAIGTIVDFREERSYRRQSATTTFDAGNYEYYRAPVIRFMTRAGRTVDLQAMTGGLPEGLSLGDAIEVVYLPARPQKAEVKGSDRLSAGAAATALLGTAGLLPGLFLFATARYPHAPRRG